MSARADKHRQPLESTYRLQFHAGFTFRDATAIVPYLAELGVTHIYASPYLKARPGSTHGYDVIDPCSLNPEIGTEADYNVWLATMREHGLSHILDIVPNHMGVGTNENQWWNDVLKHGRSSRYAAFFDIVWRGSPRGSMHDKVLLPVLGGPYGETLDSGGLKLSRQVDEYFVSYYDRKFPISPETRGIAAEVMKDGSVERLDDLLNRQHYRLAYWRVASDEINYRRFFDINDLAALSMERDDVFDATHAFILQLVADRKVAGLRVDHPDGLYDPQRYFAKLRERGATYVVAEKILASDESLPANWQINGTTGYDFLNKINGLFIDPAGEEPLTRIYYQWTDDHRPFAELAYEKKRLILDTSLASELQMLVQQLDEIAQHDRHSRDFTLGGLRDALREVIACFGVYRTYITTSNVADQDRQHIYSATQLAIAKNPAMSQGVFEFIERMLLSKPQFAGKFQQLTSPVTAKGIEDTAFYIYNRLVSLNEVGGDPDRFGVSPDELHAYLADRQKHWPHALSPLATHDTKRGEDVRARINVLSEIPHKWRQHVSRWRQMNAVCRDGGGDAPSSNEEYLLYQTLLGAWPIDSDRIKAYMTKASREAKVRSSWISPNEGYESATHRFINGILASQEFVRDLKQFHSRVSHIGYLNSLSQTLLRLTAPGVPDTYQGTELWDFSLVDPDNRRPVDYACRRQMLSELKEWSDDRASLARELIDSKEDGRVKLWVTQLALRCRLENAGLFSDGEYIPLQVTGERREHVFAFRRRRGGVSVIVVVPRLIARLTSDNQLPLGEEVWSDTQIQTSYDDPMKYKNVFTRAAYDTDLHVGQILREFPVALLVGRR